MKKVTADIWLGAYNLFAYYNVVIKDVMSVSLYNDYN